MDYLTNMEQERIDLSCVIQVAKVDPKVKIAAKTKNLINIGDLIKVTHVVGSIHRLSRGGYSSPSYHFENLMTGAKFGGQYSVVRNIFDYICEYQVIKDEI